MLRTALRTARLRAAHAARRNPLLVLLPLLLLFLAVAAHVDHKAVKGVLPSAAGAGGFGALSHDHPREGGAYRRAWGREWVSAEDGRCRSVHAAAAAAQPSPPPPLPACPQLRSTWTTAPPRRSCQRWLGWEPWGRGSWRNGARDRSEDRESWAVALRQHRGDACGCASTVPGSSIKSIGVVWIQRLQTWKERTSSGRGGCGTRRCVRWWRCTPCVDVGRR